MPKPKPPCQIDVDCLEVTVLEATELERNLALHARTATNCLGNPNAERPRFAALHFDARHLGEQGLAECLKLQQSALEKAVATNRLAADQSIVMSPLSRREHCQVWLCPSKGNCEAPV